MILYQTYHEILLNAFMEKQIGNTYVAWTLNPIIKTITAFFRLRKKRELVNL